MITQVFKKKFTLVELIIVIIAVGLIAGLAIPKFINIQRDAQISVLYKDLDALDSAAQVYYTNNDNYPITGSVLVLDTNGEAFKAITATGDSGSQLYKVDLSKTSQYTTKLRYGNNSTDANDYFIYSLESNQVFYAKGISNGSGQVVYGLGNDIIRNVVLGTTNLSANKTPQILGGIYTLTGEIKNGQTVKVSLNGTSVPVSYLGSSYYNKIDIYAGNSTYTKFSTTISLLNNTKNVIEVSSPQEKITFNVQTTNELNHAPTAVIDMPPNANLTTATNISYNSTSSYDPDMGDTITASQWQLDSGTITNTPPNGTISTIENHTIKLRVQDCKGAWSSWVSITFAINFANPNVIWNPSDKGLSINLSNNNLTVTNDSNGWSNELVRTNISKTSGKWYYEVTHLSGPNNQYVLIGIGDKNVTTDRRFALLGNTVVCYPNIEINSVIGIAIDMDNRKVVFYQDGVLLNQVFYNYYPPVGTDIYPLISCYLGSYGTNFGDSPFKYSVPSGYKAYTMN